MFTLYSNDELYSFIAKHYTETSKGTGHYGFILSALQDFNTPFGDAILEHMKEKVTKVTTLAHCVSNLYGMAVVASKYNEEYGEEFKKIATEAEKLPVEQSVERGSYLPPSEALQYFQTIESPVGRAIQCLAYTAGLTPSDLLRELNNLSEISHGLAQIGEKYHVTHTSPRTVHFDPTLLNQLDPEGEVVGVVQNIVSTVTSDNIGLKGLVLGSYYQGSGYTIADLRNSHAYNLMEEGIPPHDVAEIQGVKASQFSDRLRKFRRRAGLK